MFILARAVTYAALFVGLVLIFVPARVLSSSGILRPTAIGIWQVTGMVLGTAGAALAVSCVVAFVFLGRGTPAPFDPPRRLVIQGPYRFVRNPMYIGAGLALAGAAVFYQSFALLGYLGVLWVVHPYVRCCVRGAYAATDLRKGLPGVLRENRALVAEAVNDGWRAFSSGSKGWTRVPNGKPGDNPLSDLIVHGAHPFPRDIEEMLRRIDTLGRREGRWPLGENWPFSPREFDWERGKDLDGARQVLAHLLAILEAGRGDEVLIEPRTRRPFRSR